jgi:hypothetical protein
VSGFTNSGNCVTGEEHMRISLISGIVPAICSDLRGAPIPADLRPTPEATAEQLDSAKKAYAKHGAKYECDWDLQRRQVIHAFRMPEATNATLKGLYNLPFRFGLILYGTKITNAAPRRRTPA